MATLRLFLHLCERGSFSAAARELRIKQSTASKWVAELERGLGVALVERTTRSLRITDAGRRLYAKAVEIVAAVDEIASELGERRSEPAGRVRISVPVVFGRLFVAPCVVEALQRYPKIEAELVFGDRYVNLVEEGFDLAVRVGIPVDTSARGRKLADSTRCLVASPSYLSIYGRPRAPIDLAGHQCLVHGDSSASGSWRFRKGRGPERAITVHGRIAANNSEAVLHMTRVGLGVALLADWLVKDDLANGTLERLLVDYQSPPAPVYALTPPSRYMSAAVRAVLDHVTTSLHTVLR